MSREPSRNVSIDTVTLADDLAVLVLSLTDTGERTVNDILADAVVKAQEYRRSRMQDATAARDGGSTT